jgi:dihydropteroate synthase-like protein
VKVLIVTGKLAESLVRDMSGKADVLVLPVKIAAFITPAMLERYATRLKKYDLILIPGLIKESFLSLEKSISVPIRLGPKHAGDLSYVLPLLKKLRLSRKIPACELVEGKKKKEAFRILERLERKATYDFLLRRVKIGGSSRMKVMGEICDSCRMDDSKLRRKIQDFIKNGADIIDLGISEKKEVKRVIRIANSYNVPLSVDTQDPENIRIAMSEGIDLILSLEENLLREVGKEVAEEEVASVIIPGKNSIEQNISLARKLGIRKIIADPVLRPLSRGAIYSIAECINFRRKDRKTPLFFGCGNITESIDADSIGVNALLAGIASEIGADILFTPEKSRKTSGSVQELSQASRMMQLSKYRKSEPKDLGIDLLVVKEKRERREEGEVSGKFIRAEESKRWKADPKGYFRIFLKNGSIIASSSRVTISGKSAKEILDTIIRNKLVSTIENAGYLGRELMKAEIALKYGRSYQQE